MKIIESQYVSIGQPQYYGCGSDWEYNGSCYSQYQTGSVVYNCPSGWSLSGTTCSRNVSQSPIGYK